MRKMLSLLLSLALIGGLAACGQDGAANTTTDTLESSTVSQQQESTPETPYDAADEETPTESEEEINASESETSGILIAYFSWSGNTKQMAQMIQTETSGDLFEITPAVPYTEDYDSLLDVAQEEQSEDARPELAAQVENWDSYDVVFVGYPNWWNDAPMIIYSFLEGYDWDGKTLIPFCTSGGSAFGRSTGKLPDSAPWAEILEGLHISGSRVESAGEEVVDWIGGLSLHEAP